jgi:predicted enzyme related to lactoylglutathione lyase
MIRLHIILLFFVLVLLAACGRNSVTLPTITDERDGNYLYGKFVWHDLITHDVAVARDFYRELLGWEFEGRGGDDAPYLTAVFNDRPLAGIVKADRLEENVNESRWVSYISVPDVDNAAGYILNNSGMIFKAPADYDDRGRLAIVGDEQGSVFGIIMANGGDPVDIDPVRNTWLWNELITKDTEKAKDFYSGLAGYETKSAPHDTTANYIYLSREKKLRAGITEVPWENVNPNWLPYIMVDDIGAAVKRAAALGAKIIIAPDAQVREGSVAIVADPSGAVFGLQKWPL